LHIDTLFISNTGGGLIEVELEILNSFLFDDKANQSRSVTGSYIECLDNYFYMGDSVDWDFRVYNASPDNEWLKEIRMDFPEGFEVIEISNIVDQGNDTLFLTSGEPGDGASFTWIGETDEGWGVIVGDESGFFNVQGVVSESFEGDMQINYEIFGDIYGAEPHELDSFLIVSNYGPPILWLSADQYSGNIGLNDEMAVALSFNTEGLEPGVYDCVIHIVSNISEHIIPVELTVDNFVSIRNNQHAAIKIFPNPSSGFVHIKSEEIIMSMEIRGISGNIVFIKDAINMESISLNLDFLSAGIYLFQIKTDKGSFVEKIIIE
jgi:hypothetical protein